MDLVNLVDVLEVYSSLSECERRILHHLAYHPEDMQDISSTARVLDLSVLRSFLLRAEIIFQDPIDTAARATMLNASAAIKAILTEDIARPSND